VSFNREPIEIRMSANLTQTSTGGFLCRTRFVLVNDRVSRRDADSALCGSRIEKGYVHESQTHLFYCDTQCFAGHGIAIKNHEESVMKCSNPNCNRSIGLVAYRRGWFSKRRYCSKHCRNAFAADAPKLQQKRRAPSFIVAKACS
jgi:hypothetical protein